LKVALNTIPITVWDKKGISHQDKHNATKSQRTTY
jgi:hypothetical protein